MQFKELWDKFVDNNFDEDLLQEMMQIFQKKLPSEIFEEYEVPEMIFEAIDLLESKRNYKKLEDLYFLIKEKQPSLHKTVGHYFIDILTQYYLYVNDKDKLYSLKEDLIQTTEREYDLFYRSLQFALLYKQIDFVNEIIPTAYKILKKGGISISGGQEIARIKLNIELEKTYQHFLTSGSFDWVSFQEIAKQYDYNFDKESLSIMESAYRAENLSTIGVEGKIKDDNEFIILESFFLKYAFHKGLPFAISGYLWGILMEYWGEKIKKGKKWDDLFRLNEKQFDKFLAEISGIILDYKFYTIAGLWGSTFMYKMFLENDLITNNSYNKAINTIQKIKKFAYTFRTFWPYSFLNHWPLAEIVDEEEIQRIKDTAKKSFDEVKEYSPNINFFDEHLDQIEDSPAVKEKPTIKKKPAVKIPKIGRNEKVNVKYKDGSIVKDIKWKKVLNDYTSGECELID